MSGDFIWEFGQNNKKIAEFMTGTKTKPNLCKPITQKMQKENQT